MTDKEKLEAIRAEILRLVDVRGYDREMANDLLAFMDSLPNEPVSIDFEQELYNYFGQVKDFTLGMRIAKRFYDMGRKHQEPVSEELEEEIKRYRNAYYRGIHSFPFSKIARHFANWQKQQDQSTIELAEDHAMLAGMEKMKEQMMKDAIEVTVEMDAGGYPYIRQTIELYDYDNDVPLAKEGDTVRVIVIKED